MGKSIVQGERDIPRGKNDHKVTIDKAEQVWGGKLRKIIPMKDQKEVYKRRKESFQLGGEDVVTYKSNYSL